MIMIMKEKKEISNQLPETWNEIVRDLVCGDLDDETVDADVEVPTLRRLLGDNGDDVSS